MKNKALGVTLLLLCVSFILIVPGIVRHTYEQGAGHAYLQQLELVGPSTNPSLATATRLEMVATARRAGITYSAFAIAGFFVPIFALLLLFVSYCFNFTNRFRKSSVTAYASGCILIGLTGSALAQLQLVSTPTRAVQGAIGIWTLVSICFGLLFIAAWTLKKLFGRKKPARK